MMLRSLNDVRLKYFIMAMPFPKTEIITVL